jgi:hypothetical protein
MICNDLEIYALVRPEMKTGDLLLWSSNSLIGAAIRWFSKSTVSHASLIIPLSGMDVPRMFTTEALEDGIVPNFLSHRLRVYDGECYWYPLKDEWDDARAMIEYRAFQYIGVPYDYLGVLKNAFGKVSMEGRKLFCSEYVYKCYGREGMAPTPGDLMRSEIFKEPTRLI